MELERAGMKPPHLELLINKLINYKVGVVHCNILASASDGSAVVRRVMCVCVIHRCDDVRCPHRTTTTTPRMWLQAHLGLAGPRRRLPGRYLLPLLMLLCTGVRVRGSISAHYVWSACIHTRATLQHPFV